MKYRVSLQLASAPPGSGESLLDRAVRLLESIEACGAILPAARTLGLSYSCAWSSVQRAEKLLGCPLLLRAGGSTGCKLTPAGLALIREYRRVLQAAQSAAEAAETSP